MGQAKLTVGKKKGSRKKITFYIHHEIPAEFLLSLACTFYYTEFQASYTIFS